MLDVEKRLQIAQDVLIDVDSFNMKVNEGFREGRITEAEFYNAMGLVRIERILENVLKALEKLPGR